MEAEKDIKEEDLLFALESKSPMAAQYLVDLYGDRIYSLCLRILGSEEDAKDVVQEVFLTILKKWSSFQHRAKFSSWVYRVAANCAYMYIRKKKRREREVTFHLFRANSGSGDPTLKGSFAQGITEEIIKGKNLSPDEIIQNEELAKLIDIAIDALPIPNRLAFILKDIEGMSLKDIAVAMGISEAAVKSRIHRARMELRRYLRNWLERI